jgi:hypothetical protein
MELLGIADAWKLEANIFGLVVDPDEPLRVRFFLCASQLEYSLEYWLELIFAWVRALASVVEPHGRPQSAHSYAA